MLMDGAYGRLIFVATQSDVLQRSEVVRCAAIYVCPCASAHKHARACPSSALSLPSNASLVDCAAARNAFTKARIHDDFYAGLAEMAVRACVRVGGLAGERAGVWARMHASRLAGGWPCIVCKHPCVHTRVIVRECVGVCHVHRSQDDAGDAPPSRAELEQRFTLPVFTVSSVDFQATPRGQHTAHTLFVVIPRPPILLALVI